jgi:hypothetical protein
MLTAERLRELLAYDPETGAFTWCVARGRQGAGSAAGADNGDGYRGIEIDRRRYQAHRLAWLYVHGAWPAEQLDHINGAKSDNRIGNLREATNAENVRNRTPKPGTLAGAKGVTWDRDGWRARVWKDGRCHCLGRFSTVDEARAAYAAAALEHHGEFARVE